MLCWYCFYYCYFVFPINVCNVVLLRFVLCFLPSFYHSSIAVLNICLIIFSIYLKIWQLFFLLFFLLCVLSFCCYLFLGFPIIFLFICLFSSYIIFLNLSWRSMWNLSWKLMLDSNWRNDPEVLRMSQLTHLYHPPEMSRMLRMSCALQW